MESISHVLVNIDQLVLKKIVKNVCFVAFVDSHGINTPTVAGMKLLT